VTLRAFQFSPPDASGRRWPVGGRRWASLTIFTDPIQSFTEHALGQSNHPGSPHYTDEARLSSERRMKPTHFYREELLPHVNSVKVLDVPRFLGRGKEPDLDRTTDCEPTGTHQTCGPSNR
jgi:hypothetical protein